MSLSFFFIQIIFAAMGFIMAVVIKKIKSVLPVALSTVFALFSIGAIGAALQREEFYYLSPFKYFDPLYIIQHNAYHGQFVIVGAVFVVAAVVLSYALFVKKDIHAV